MKTIFPAILLSIVTALAPCPQPGVSDGELLQLIGEHLKDFPDQTELAIAMVDVGQTRFQGVVKENGTLKSTDNEEMVFEIGSITKLFTSVILVSLVNEGKVRLEEPVHRYLPMPPREGSKITLLSLANHTSGLPRMPDNMSPVDPDNPYKNYRPENLEAFLKGYEIERDSMMGRYLYSNLGTGLLGYVLGLSQGVSYEDLLRERVFDRYGMKQSYTRASDAGNRLVRGLNARGEVTSNWDFDVLMGAGGVLSTARDLAAFARAQFNEKDSDLMLTQIPTHKVNERLKLGLGWHIVQGESGKEYHCHNGGTGGYSSSLTVNMTDKVAVIILSNISAFHPAASQVERLCFRLIGRMEQNRN
jgi:CubicO group peptidase (beta-lactamase class C family)